MRSAVARVGGTSPPISGSLRETYAGLLARSRGDGNDAALAQIVAAWCRGRSVLPRWLGLSGNCFREVIRFHFGGGRGVRPSRGAVTIPSFRLDEVGDLQALLLTHRAGRTGSEVWVAKIICAGCLGRGHLWSDLGLHSRTDLSVLIKQNFPRLHAKNDRNMRWKKFFYKQLCEGKGLYLCRAPSCEECSEFSKCFLPDQ